MEPGANPAAPEPVTPPNAGVPAAPEPVQADPGAPQEVAAGQPAPTLEQVHQATLNKLENEPDPVLDENGEPIDPPVPEPEPVAEPPVEPPAPEPEPEPAPLPEPTPPPAPAQAPVAPNTDTSVNGDGKIAVKAFDGSTLYLNSLDELPEDFEPASYKQFGVAVQQLTDKAQSQRFADQAAADLKTEQDAQAAIDANAKAIGVSWNNDIDRLTATGVLPNDEAKRQPILDEVYGYIQDQVNKGVVVDNFEMAYKTVMYDKMVAKQAEDQKKLDAAKKQRGGLVQGGGSAEAPRGRYVEAPPAGTTLDQVHEKYTHQLAR